MALAVCGSSIQTFEDGQQYTLKSSYAGTSDVQFKAVSWCRDISWIVCSTDKGKFPVLRYKNGELISGKEIEINNATIATYCNTSDRNVAVGNEKGELILWDLKESKSSRVIPFKLSSSVGHISVNNDDSQVAGATSLTPNISIVSLLTNKVVSLLQLPNSNEISCLKYASTRKRLLGASSLDNVVSVWDVVKSKPTFINFDCHKGSCSGISFSPLNDFLLSSVSLDRSLNLYDMRENKKIMSVFSPSALTCVDIHQDGKQIITGSMSGVVFIYDLRNLGTCSQSFKAQEGTILNIQSQPSKPKNYNPTSVGTPEIVDLANELSSNFSVTDILSPSKSICKESSIKEEASTPISEQTFCADSFLQDIAGSVILNGNESVIQERIVDTASPLVLRRISDFNRRGNGLLQNNLTQTGTGKSIKVASTPTDNIKTSPNHSYISPITGSGDGKHLIGIQTNDVLKQLKSEMLFLLNEEVKSIRDQISSLKDNILEILYGDLIKTIRSNYCMLQLGIVQLKLEQERIESETADRFQSLHDCLILIAEELHKLTERI